MVGYLSKKPKYFCGWFRNLYKQRRCATQAKGLKTLDPKAEVEEPSESPRESVDGWLSYQSWFGLTSVQVHHRSQGTLLPLSVNPRYRIHGTMCNARSNLISGKALISRGCFASNLLDHHQNSSSLPHSGGSKRKRGENQSRDWIGSFVEVPR
jgi:hypothetical protein